MKNASKKTIRKILFLDVDGVLNDKNSIKDLVPIGTRQMQNLRLVVENTQCEIVLSSTWRKYQDRLQQLAQSFQSFAIPHWIDETAVLDTDRWKEIQKWINENCYGSTCIVSLDDDDDADITNLNTAINFCHFVQTNSDEGLVLDKAFEVIDKFTQAENDQKSFLIETYKLGWSLFEEDNTGEIQLWALDDPDEVAECYSIAIDKRYNGSNADRQAAEDCQTMANEGNMICQKAIEILISNNSSDVDKFNLVKNW
jgi:hypothetical protein